MKIAYASDLHLECASNTEYMRVHPLNPASDVLILAGDIGNLADMCIHPFFDWATKHYAQVLIVPGNQEFYDNDKLEEMRDGYILPIRENVLLGYNAIVTIGNTNFILSTLWGFIRPEFRYVTQRNAADCGRSRYNGHTPHTELFNEEHEKAMLFLQDAIAASKAEKRVVVIHYLPTALCMAPHFKNNPP